MLISSLLTNSGFFMKIQSFIQTKILLGGFTYIYMINLDYKGNLLNATIAISKKIEMKEKNILTDHLLLQEIFSNLTISELKNARLVCRAWGEEGALNFRHRAFGLSIHVNPAHITQESRMNDLNLKRVRGRAEEWEALKNFLKAYKLPHTLLLSLLNFHPWLDNTIPFNEFYCVRGQGHFGDIVTYPFFKQHNNYKFIATLLSDYLPQTAPFIKELRLEVMLKRGQDFEILEQILEKVETGLEVFSLDIAVFNPDLLQTVELSKDHSGSKIKTIAIRLTPRPRTFERLPGLNPPGPFRLLSLFPNVSFLDLVGWRPIDQINTIQIRDKTRKFLDAAIDLELKLDGIHAAPENGGDYDAILNYSRKNPLKGLYLSVYWKGDEAFSTFQTLEQILIECEATIERFDLTWRATDLGRPPIRIPQLVKLKSLTYASKFLGAYEPGFGPEGTRFDNDILQDMFGFKELFSDSGAMLKFQFPALESLSLILVGPGDQELWEEIFQAENNEKCINSKIQTLVVTFAGECESEKIQKFPLTLFPKVKQFRHGKWSEDGDKLFVCHHEYDDRRRLIRKWNWLAAVNKFIGFDPQANNVHTINNYGNYFWTIREKFRARLGDDGFWDTGYDIERPELYTRND